MTRIIQKLILTMLLAIFATQANAMFIQPDWWDPSQPGVGTNRYMYSHGDPINKMDPSGHDTIWQNSNGSWSSSDGSTYDPSDGSGSYDFGSDQYGYTNGLGFSPAEQPGYQSKDQIADLPSSGRSRVGSVTDRGVTASFLYHPSSPFDTPFGSVQHSEAERFVQGFQPESGAAGLVFDVSVLALGVGTGPANVTQVGRWMSPKEYGKMKLSGRVVESSSGLTHVANPASSAVFVKQAPAGSLYVEFGVSTRSLMPSGSGASTILTPNSNAAIRLTKLGRTAPTVSPRVYGPQIRRTK